MFSVPGGVDNAACTTQGGEPGSSSGCPAMLRTAWWRIAGTGRQIALSTSGSSFDTVLSAYDQGDLAPSAANRLACDDDDDDASGTGTSSTAFAALSIRHVVAGSRIELRCRGVGCFERRVITVRSAAASRSLLGYVRGARPRRGAVIEIRVTKSRTTGVVRRLTVRGGTRLPRKQDLCLPFAGDPPARC